MLIGGRRIDDEELLVTNDHDDFISSRSKWWLLFIVRFPKELEYLIVPFSFVQPNGEMRLELSPDGRLLKV
jgi:hypothetical protein